MKSALKAFAVNGLLRDQPLVPQVQDLIIHLIQNQRIAAGARMPPILQMAEDLRVSHCTIEKVYARLSLQKMLVSKGRQGTFVRLNQDDSGFELEKVLKRDAAFKFRKANKLVKVSGLNQVNWLDIGSDLPDMQDMLDLKIVSIYKEVAAAYSVGRYKQQLTDTCLDDAILSLLNDRGLNINKQQFIYAPEQACLLQLVFRSLLHPGDIAVIPSASEKFFYTQLLHSSLAEIKFSGSDAEGMNTDSLERICRKHRVKLVLVRPSADYPDPVSLSTPRRNKLLKLAETYNFVIAEVDEEPGFSYGDYQLPLISRSGSTRVIYISPLSSMMRTQFSRKIIVGPENFIRNLKAMCLPGLYERNLVMEKTISRVIDEKILASHVRRMQKIYSQRRNELISLIDYYLNNQASYSPPAAGLNFMIKMNEPAERNRLQGILQQNQLFNPIYSANRIPAERVDSLRIGFGSVNLNHLECFFKLL